MTQKLRLGFHKVALQPRAELGVLKCSIKGQYSSGFNWSLLKLTAHKKFLWRSGVANYNYLFNCIAYLLPKNRKAQHMFSVEKFNKLYREQKFLPNAGLAPKPQACVKAFKGRFRWENNLWASLCLKQSSRTICVEVAKIRQQPRVSILQMESLVFRYWCLCRQISGVF